jgi:phospholipase C
LKKTLVILLLSLCAPLGFAQQFRHVVIVVQENRTPDNLFADCNIPGADARRNGKAIALNTSYNPDHKHSSFLRQQKGVGKRQYCVRPGIRRAAIL